LRGALLYLPRQPDFEVPVRFLCSLIVLAAACAVEAQQPAERPTFRSGRELLLIEASVRDKAGSPVTDLQPSDFTVRVDGRERQVVTSRLFGVIPSGAAASAPPVAGSVANVDQPAGRAVVIAIDRDSIRPGGEKPLLDAAARLVEGLGPSDAAAAASLPGATTDFTRDHAVVAAAVRRMTGTMPLFDTRLFLTFEEAAAFERKDSLTIQAARSRECITGGAQCYNDLAMQAHNMWTIGMAHADDILRRVGAIVSDLAKISAPKRLVLISAGIPFDPELIGRYRDLARRAAQSHVTLLIVQMDQSPFDTGSRGPTVQVFGGREHAEGLGNIASITGGRFFSAVGNAQGVFDRIASDISTFYQPGVESRPSDADGKSHKVEVKVTRAGATVTAPAATAVALQPTRTPVERLRAALAEPTDVNELPLEVATYATHSQDPGKVRIIVTAGGSQPTQPPPTHWASVILDGDTILGGVGDAVDAGAPAPWSKSGAVDVAPGRYRLRTAIAAGDRVGTLELPLTVGLRAVGSARASDLILGVTNGGRLEPAGRFSPDTKARALIELSSSQPMTDLAGYVIFVPAGSDTPLVLTPLAFHPRSDGVAVVIGEAALDLSTLAPGRYVAMASIEQNGKPVGRVSRAFEVVR
jgi:VWFA-related protein